MAGHGILVVHQETMAYGGLLHQRLAQPLMKISEQQDISFTAFILETVAEIASPGAKPSHRLCINVFGSTKLSRIIGHVLDNAGIFLQHPQTSDLVVPYLNPHYLVRPGGRHPEPIPELHLSTALQTPWKFSTDYQVKNDVLQALDCSAQGPSEYSQINPSVSIRTALKP